MLQRIFLLGIFILLTFQPANAGAQNVNHRIFWEDIYEKNEVLQDFFPFRVSVPNSRDQYLSVDEHEGPKKELNIEIIKFKVRHWLGLYTENYINAIHTGSGGHGIFKKYTTDERKALAIEREVESIPYDYLWMDAGLPYLSEYGKALFDELGVDFTGESPPQFGNPTTSNKDYQIKIQISFQDWYGYNTESKYDIDAQRDAVVGWARRMKERYPDLIYAYGIDDEPLQWLNYQESFLEKLEEVHEETGQIFTVTHPTYDYLAITGLLRGFSTFDPLFAVVDYDWYFLNEVARQNWSFERKFSFLLKKDQNHQTIFPNQVFYFTPLAGTYYSGRRIPGHRHTKPGLPDSRPTREELRFQVWQAIAYGCKGLSFYRMYNEWPWWGQGEDPLRNVVYEPNTNFLIEEVKRLGEQITAIGPLLLSCYYVADINEIDETTGFELENTKMIHFPEVYFNDDLYNHNLPAVGSTFLKDVNRDRLYFIAYNRDILKGSKAVLKLNTEYLSRNDYRIYDLNSVTEITGVPDNLIGLTQFQINIPDPGDGRVYVICPECEFQGYTHPEGEVEGCKDTIYRHKALNEKAIVDVRIKRAEVNGVDFENHVHLSFKTGDLISKADKLFRQGKYKTAWELYMMAKQAVAGAIAQNKETKIAELLLRGIARRLSESDEILRTHRKILNMKDPHYYNGFHYITTTNTTLKPDINAAIGDHSNTAGDVVSKWFDITHKYDILYKDYLTIQNITGKFDAFIPELIDLYNEAENNKRKIRNISYICLKNRRMTENNIRGGKPVEVVFITPNRHEDEYNYIYSWLYENVDVKWFVTRGFGLIEVGFNLLSQYPDESYCPDYDDPDLFAFVHQFGGDYQIRPFEGEDHLDPTEFDVIWIHQLQFNNPTDPGGKPYNTDSLMPVIKTPTFKRVVLETLNRGGGLILTGIAGLYTIDLGVESHYPDFFEQDGYIERSPSKTWPYHEYCDYFSVNYAKKPYYIFKDFPVIDTKEYPCAPRDVQTNSPIGLAPCLTNPVNPLFGFDVKPFYTNQVMFGGWYLYNTSPNCAWLSYIIDPENLHQSKGTDGLVLANMMRQGVSFTDEYKEELRNKGKLILEGKKKLIYDNFAAIILYDKNHRNMRNRVLRGDGKIIVFGGFPCDLTPAKTPYSNEEITSQEELQDQIYGIMLHCIDYLAK